MIDADQPSPAGADSQVRQRFGVGGDFRELGIVIALVLLCAFFWWRSPGVFTKPANLAVIMRFVATFGTLGIGALIMQVLRNGLVLTGVSAHWLQALQRFVIVMAIMVDQLRKRRR